MERRKQKLEKQRNIKSKKVRKEIFLNDLYFSFWGQFN